MGWASGGNIFNNVAQGLIDADASDEIMRSVLTNLAEALTGEDWDTVDESIQEFAHEPVIVELLIRLNGVQYLGRTGEIALDGGSWLLMCSDCPSGQDEWPEDDTAEGHDRLVRLWATHDAEHHGGDGSVPEYALILRGGA